MGGREKGRREKRREGGSDGGKEERKDGRTEGRKEGRKCLLLINYYITPPYMWWCKGSLRARLIAGTAQ